MLYPRRTTETLSGTLSGRWQLGQQEKPPGIAEGLNVVAVIAGACSATVLAVNYFRLSLRLQCDLRRDGPLSNLGQKALQSPAISAASAGWREGCLGAVARGAVSWGFTGTKFAA